MIKSHESFMRLNKIYAILALAIVLIHSNIYSQMDILRKVTVPDANNFAYPQSIFVDSPNGHIWITDFSNHRVLRFDISTLTNSDRSPVDNIPGKYFLSQNYPNPFNPSTQISFSLPTTSQASLKVYNLLGQEVAVLFNEIATSHSLYAISFDAKHLPSGMYLYTLRTVSGSEIRRMCLLK